MIREFLTQRRAAEKTTILDALLASRILSKIPEIDGVEVFGGVARDAVGSDLDMILIVPENISRRFLAETSKKLNTKYLKLIPKGFVNARLAIAKKILGDEFSKLIEEMEKSKPGVEFDCFLFPSNWRDRLSELQNAIPHRDPQFMSNIAKSAIKIL